MMTLRRCGNAPALVIAARHARTPSGSMVTSSVTGSIASTRQPSAKVDVISSRDTRRGPDPAGWRSLKQSMK
jgi:hypothetical protein